MTLQYWREYRTQFHIALDFGVSEATVCRTIIKVENELVRSGRFRLPSKRRLLETEIGMSAALVDVTEVTTDSPSQEISYFVRTLPQSPSSFGLKSSSSGWHYQLRTFSVYLIYARGLFSRAWPVLDSSGEIVRPERAFEEARKAISHYRLNQLLKSEASGFDALSQWYFLTWDTFQAREFPFDDARQLALAVGGFNINDLKTEYKAIEAKSGTCTLLTPQ